MKQIKYICIYGYKSEESKSACMDVLGIYSFNFTLILPDTFQPSFLSNVTVYTS